MIKKKVTIQIFQKFEKYSNLDREIGVKIQNDLLRKKDNMWHNI